MIHEPTYTERLVPATKVGEHSKKRWSVHCSCSKWWLEDVLKQKAKKVFEQHKRERVGLDDKET